MVIPIFPTRNPRKRVRWKEKLPISRYDFQDFMSYLRIVAELSDIGKLAKQHKRGAYTVQQSYSTCFPDAVHLMKSDVGQQVWANWLNNAKQGPRQSSSGPSSSGMGSGDAVHPLKSDGVRQIWTNMASNPSDAPKLSIGEPCNVTGNVQGEAPILSSGSVKNDSGSSRSPASISNSNTRTLPSGNCEFNSAAEGISPLSSDSAGTPQNMQPQEMKVQPEETNPQAQELDDVWKDLGDIEGVNYDNLL